MSATKTLKIEKATPTVGAEVLDVDLDRVLNDEDLPQAVMAAAEEHGALLFRELRLDDETQAAFCKKMGEVVSFSGYPIPEVMVITLDPGNPNAEYFKGNVQWHIDGTQDARPAKATLLTAHVVSDEGGETGFASTYAAYDDLSDEEKERLASLRVVHSLEAILRPVYDDPTPEQLEKWKSRGSKELPLVWTHQSGRKSLVLGATADYVVGMDAEEGRALMKDLLDRATTPDRVFEHTWTVGDVVIWDNTGTVHRAMPFDPASGREMHRTTWVGDEEVQ
ncbi:MAG: TauD/TfdA family dioxygenase [Actinomycetota bacterium]|nr:TauD/TfdA family dioxygenase [Actinomycetota bacterium]